ncbi:MAG: DMT family transporter [Canibacter sp.]
MTITNTVSTASPVSHSRTKQALALTVCCLVGALVAIQSRITAGLARHIHDGYLAAVISFGFGLIILTVILACSKRSRAGLTTVVAETRAGKFPWWALTGGFFGAFFVLTQSIAAGVLGLAVFTVGIVAGQVLGGLVMDLIGVGPAGKIGATLGRVLGTGLAIVAVVIEASGSTLSGSTLLMIVLPFAAGIGMSGQAAFNGLVRSVARSAIAATFVNFAVGTAFLAIFAIISIIVNGWPTGWPVNPVWYVAGGLGCLFIAMQALLVHVVGVLMFSMANVAGQLVGSVLIELGLPLGEAVTVSVIIGAVVALLAVMVGALPNRKVVFSKTT